MAYIRKYRDKWRAEVQRHGHRVTHVTETKREAQAWALKKESELDALKGSGGRSFATATAHYLATVSTHKRDAVEWERRRFEAMGEFFGDCALSDIDSERIGQWRDKRLESVGGSTVLREANLLRHLFTLAVDEWQWLARHPFKGVRLPKESEARHQLWRWQEIRRVIRAGKRAGGKTQEVAEAFHIALRTGMRLSEVLASPAGFDSARKVVTLDQTKTGGREQIPVGRIAAKLLQRPAFKVGPNEASALFSRLTGQLMIDDLTFHDARAIALTLLSKKVDVMVLARISRHKDISLLHRVYYRATADEIAAKL